MCSLAFLELFNKCFLILRLLVSMIDEKKLKDFRRELHKNPELSGQEFETQKRISSFIQSEIGLEGEKIGNTGLLYSLKFGKGPRVMARFDIDALPIQEINEFPHRSVNEGVSHKCGHDGHTSIGVGLLSNLKDEPMKAGRVDILFQPAEEIGEGAVAVLADKNFDLSSYDFAIAMHNIPGAELNKLIVKEREFTPAVHSIIFRIQGKTSHAAEPLKGDNPAYIMSEIMLKAMAMEDTDEKSESYGLITPVHSVLGSADYGISAGYAELHFTLRTWEQSKLETLTSNFINEVKHLVERRPFEFETEKLAVFAANYNEPKVVNAIKKAGKKIELNVEEKQKPFPWGEDFGLFTHKIPGAMFGLGSGIDCPALHNPDYDFPDEISKTAIEVFYNSIENLIHGKEQ